MFKKLLCVSLLLAGTSLADAVSATFTATGTPGAYVLDFTFTSNLEQPTNHSLYWFGVDLSSVWDGVNQTGPAAFDCIFGYDISVSFGGPAGEYRTWYDSSYNGIPDPGSLSGFQIGVTSPVLPTTVNFWAFSYAGGPQYGGSFDFHEKTHPGFVGTATLVSSPTAVPEPNPAPALALLGGLLVVIRARRR